MRTLYLILQILLAPFVLLNLMICVAGVTTVLGVSHDSSLLLMILAVVLGIGAWGLNGATVRVLTGNAPTWMRLLWLPGLLFSVVVTFDTYLSPSGATMLNCLAARAAGDVRPEIRRPLGFCSRDGGKHHRHHPAGKIAEGGRVSSRYI